MILFWPVRWFGLVFANTQIAAEIASEWGESVWTDNEAYRIEVVKRQNKRR